jgi:hypothetical protein
MPDRPDRVEFVRKDGTISVSHGPGHGPPRGYSRPPFQPGHWLSTKHGAWSPRKVEPLAAELVEQLLAHAREDRSPVAYLAEPSYLLTIWALGRTEARIQLVSEWLLDRGSELDEAGGAVGAANLLNKLESRAESLRSKLGLDPLSRARLGRDVSAAKVDMAKLMADLDDEDSLA